MAYAFRTMVEADLPLVQGWVQISDVARWWDGGFDRERLSRPHVRSWIVSHEERPFAYLQDYDPHTQLGHPFLHLPTMSRGLDQFIGEPDMLGRGHGPAFIGAHVDRLFTEGAPAIGVDPHPDNARAIRAYEKSGFSPIESCETLWGLCLLMTRHSPSERSVKKRS